MVASNVRERDRIFLRWLENVERLLGRHVDRGLQGVDRPTATASAICR
jgi:hypothetical protein